MRVGIDCRKIDDYGIGTYLRGLLGELTARRELNLVCFGDPRPEPRAGVSSVAFDAPLYSLRELRQARAAIRQSDGIDVFHEPHYTLPYVDQPSVVTIHDLIHLERRGLRFAHQRLYAGAMIASALRRAAEVITVSAATADGLRRRFGTKARITVIANGVDERLRTPVSDSVLSESLRAIGVERQGYFLYVGNDLPHKNLSTVLDAFAAVREQQRVCLVLAGGARAERAGSGVVKPGRVSDEQLRMLYRGAIALVLASDQEGFGLTVAEAMASGTPVIASNIAVLREISGGHALFVSPRNPQELAMAMWRLLDEARLREDLGARGAEFAQRYSWKGAAEATLDVYRRAAKW